MRFLHNERAGLALSVIPDRVYCRYYPSSHIFMISDKKIQEFGLSDKEAKVYMSLLELGQATAQQLALRSGVNRATVYVMLESLMKRGLASTVDKDGKTFFMIEEPFSLLKHLEEERNNVEEKIVLARKVIPELQQVYNLSRDRSKVRLFEGKEYIRIIQNEILRSKGKEVFQISNANLAENYKEETQTEMRKTIVKSNYSIKSVLTIDPTKPKPDLSGSGLIQYRFLDYKDHRVDSEIVLFDGKKVAHLTLTGSLIGVVIENEEIYSTMKIMFDALWEKAFTKIDKIYQ